MTFLVLLLALLAERFSRWRLRVQQDLFWLRLLDRVEMDPELVVPNPDLSVNEGAVKPLGAVGEATTWGSDIVRAAARERGIDLNRPWKALSEAQRRVILFGTGDERVSVRYHGSMGTGAFKMRYEGAINSMMRRMRDTKSEEMRQYYQRFLSSRPCSACGGRRVRPEALGVKIAGRTIAEVTALSVAAEARARRMDRSVRMAPATQVLQVVSMPIRVKASSTAWRSTRTCITTGAWPTPWPTWEVVHEFHRV